MINNIKCSSIQFMIEQVQFEQQLFEEVILNDIKETYAIQEGCTSKLVELIQEGAVKSALNGIISMFRAVKDWIVGIFDKFIGLFRQKSKEIAPKSNINPDTVENFKFKLKIREEDIAGLLLSIQPPKPGIDQFLKGNFSKDDIDYIKSAEFKEEQLGRTIKKQKCSISDYKKEVLNFCFKQEEEIEYTFKEEYSIYNTMPKLMNERINNLENDKKRFMKMCDDAINDANKYTNKTDINQNALQYYVELQKSMKDIIMHNISAKIEVENFKLKQDER